MRAPTQAAALNSAAGGASNPATGSAANDDAALTNGKIKIAEENGDQGYRQPKTAIYADTRAKMMKRQVLEEYVKFLAPLKLPEDDLGLCRRVRRRRRLALLLARQPRDGDVLPVYEDDGGSRRADHRGGGRKSQAFPMKVNRDGFLAGRFRAGVILHETGHALFDGSTCRSWAAKRTPPTRSRPSSRCSSSPSSPTSSLRPTPTSAKPSPIRRPRRQTRNDPHSPKGQDAAVLR